jgi:TolA protein
VGSEVILPTRDSAELKDILHSSEAINPIIIKSKINSITATPIKKQNINKLNIEEAVSAIRQKKQSKARNTESAPASGTSRISDAEINSQTNAYIGAVWSIVKQNWTMPQALMPDKDITTIINVRIARSGALIHADFEKHSGNRYFDNSALRAVTKSSPFPPLPYWMMDNSIEIGIRFHSTELR